MVGPYQYAADTFLKFKIEPLKMGGLILISKERLKAYATKTLNVSTAGREGDS